MSYTQFKLFRWFMKRLLVEDIHSLLFSTSISLILLVFLSRKYIETVNILIKYLGSTGVISNIALGVGTLIGFLASVPTTTIISSMLFKDKSSKFIEIILSAPFSYREYLTSFTFSVVSLGIIINVLMIITYICTVAIVSPNVFNIMTNGLIYVVSILITVITSLFAIVANLTLFKISQKVRIGGLVSTLPSLLIYLIIVLLVKPFHIHTTLWPILNTLIITTIIIVIALTITIAKIIKPETLLTT